MGIKEERIRIEGRQELAVFFLDDGFQLIDISNKQQLLAAKRLAHVPVVYTQHFVDKVENVGSHHADLINNNEFQFLQDFPFLTVIAQRIADIACIVSGVVGQERVEGQFEETMQRASAHINGCDTGGSEYHVLLFRMFADVS